MTMRAKIIGLLLLAGWGLTGAEVARGQCEQTLQNESAPDIEYVGLRPDGRRAWVGQTFTTTSDGHFESAAFLVKADLFPLAGVAPLGTGDLLRCTLLDGNDFPIASVTAPLAAGFALQWVTFDFAPLTLGLAAGPLSVRVGAEADGYLWVGTSGDVVAGQLTLGDETSAFTSSQRDTSFRVAWNTCTPVVAVEGQTWGGVKALFR